MQLKWINQLNVNTIWWYSLHYGQSHICPRSNWIGQMCPQFALSLSFQIPQKRCVFRNYGQLCCNALMMVVRDTQINSDRVTSNIINLSVAPWAPNITSRYIYIYKWVWDDKRLSLLPPILRQYIPLMVATVINQTSTVLYSSCLPSR